jgi:hypothetical protein
LSASDIKTGHGKIFLENLNCLGNEMDVETCTFTNWENNHCTHSNDVGIDCGKYLKYIFKIAYYYFSKMSSYRLVNYLTFK